MEGIICRSLWYFNRLLLQVIVQTVINHSQGRRSKYKHLDNLFLLCNVSSYHIYVLYIKNRNFCER